MSGTRRNGNPETPREAGGYASGQKASRSIGKAERMLRMAFCAEAGAAIVAVFVSGFGMFLDLSGARRNGNPETQRGLVLMLRVKKPPEA